MNSLRYVIFIVVINWSSFTFSQTYSNVISDEEILDFVTYILDNEIVGYKDSVGQAKRISRSILDFDTSKIKFPEIIRVSNLIIERGIFINLGRAFTLDDKNDSILIKSDRAYLLNQYENIKSKTWHNKLSIHKLKESRNTAKNPIHFLSIPLFSQNMKTAVISHEYYCGPLCAWGNIRVYRKDESGNWKKVFQTVGWRS